MGVDFSKVKTKALEEKQKANRTFERIRWWKPKVGENRIRLMPPWTDEGPNASQFWREIYQHWNIGEGGFDDENGYRFTCPVRTPDGPEGAVCEVCDLHQQLRASGDPADAEIAKEIRAKMSVMSNIVDMDDAVFTEDDISDWEENNSGKECPFDLGDTKIQVYSYGSKLFKQLLDLFSDEIDLTDLETGRVLIITREGRGKFDTEYRLRPDFNPKPFEVIGDFDELIYNLDGVSPFPSDGAMARALNGENPYQKAQLTSGGVKASAVLGKGSPSKEDEEFEVPECFEDPDVHDAEDPNCVGGVVANEDGSEEEIEKCPVFDTCKTAVEAKLNPAPSKRRRSKKKVASNPDNDDIAALEAKIKSQIS